MLFWSKFLTIAHGVAISVHVFLPLYFFHLHHMTYFEIAILLFITLTTQIIACGFWTAWVDQRNQKLHGISTSLLTGLGAASLVLLLSVPPDTWLSWPAAILCMILDGWFFQPLGCLVDSAIIKILGDYKLLYEYERRWGKLSLGITALGIGCFLDDDHDFDTLMGTVVIGCAALFLLSLSANIQPADPFLLDLQIGESTHLFSNFTTLPQYYMDGSSYSHHHHKLYIHLHHHYHYHNHHQYHLTTNTDINVPSVTTPFLDSSNTSPSPYYYSTYTPYKPYSLFGGHLSHISEEDDSMLQRISSTPPRTSSLLSTKVENADQLIDCQPLQLTSSSYCPSPPLTPLPNTTHRLSTTTTATALPPPSTELPQSSSHPSPSSRHVISSIGSVYLNNNNNSSSSSSSNIDSITNDHILSSTIPTTTTDVPCSPLNKTFMSMSLALLPLPPGEIAMVILITAFPRFRPTSFHHRYQYCSLQQQQHQKKEQHQAHHPHLLMEQDNDDQYRNDELIFDDDDNDDDEDRHHWHLCILSSCFILGLIYAPMILFAPLIYHDCFDLPMHTIGLMVLIGCLSDITVTAWAPSALERSYIQHNVLLAHLILLVCIFTYSWMPSGKNPSWWLLISLLILHAAQSACIRVIWLMASCQVDFLFLPQCQDRMMLRGKMSALYSSLGPAVGSLLLGWLVTLGWSIQAIYYFTLLLIPISAALTLGWR